MTFLTSASYWYSSRSSEVISLSFFGCSKPFEDNFSSGYPGTAIWLKEPTPSFWGIAYSTGGWLHQKTTYQTWEMKYNRVRNYFEIFYYNVYSNSNNNSHLTSSGNALSFMSNNDLCFGFFFLIFIQALYHTFVFKSFWPHSTNRSFDSWTWFLAS